MKKNKLIKALFEGKVQKLRLTAALVATLLIAALDISIAWILQQVLDAVTGNDNALPLPTLTVIVICSILLEILFNMILYHTKPRFISSAMENYRNRAFELLVKKNISAFSKENTSLYISALSNDAVTVEKNYLNNIFPLVENLVLFVGAFVLMIVYSPILTLTAVLFSVFPIITSLIVGNRLGNAETLVSKKSESYTSVLKESLEGFNVIKGFKAERPLSLVLKESVMKMQESKCARDKLTILIGTIGQISGMITQIGVFLVSAFLVISGMNVSAGIVIAFVQLMNYVILPIARVPQEISEIKSAHAIADKLYMALEENYADDGKVDVKKLDCAIEIKDLSFSYNDQKQALKNINFRFEKGKSYAVVGGSGSGKSTLLSLLSLGHLNFSGNIFYDDIDIRDISSESLYDLVSIVSQKVFVFNSTLRNNITMFSEAEEEDIARAIKLSGLSEFLNEKGEDYVCGENGNALSGGEKQRISIARALLRNSQILLADEATSSLDNKNAYHIINSILGLEGLTRIVVTHSLDESLLKKYDCIIVLKDGAICESGNFYSLMEKKEYFYSLYKLSE